MVLVSVASPCRCVSVCLTVVSLFESCRGACSQRLKVRSGDHPDESDTDEGEADVTDGMTQGTNSTWETNNSASDTASLHSRSDDDGRSVGNDDVASVRSGFTGMSLGSIASVSATQRRKKRKERWRSVKMPDEIRKLEAKRPKGTIPPLLSGEQLQLMPRDRPWLQFEVTGLRPGSVHTFRVKARNAKGWSDVSTPAMETRVQPDVPLVPFDVVATPLSPFSMLIRWKSPHHNGAPLQYYHLQSCRMRYCDDDDDSDSDVERCPGGENVGGRQKRLIDLKTGVPMPLREIEPTVDPWADVPVSEWIARKLGGKIPRLLNLVSAGDSLQGNDDDDSDLDSPRDYYKIVGDQLEEFNVTVPKSSKELQDLEQWALAYQHKLASRHRSGIVTASDAFRSEDVRDDDNRPGFQCDDDCDADDVRGENALTRRRRVEQVIGPRIPLSHGKQLAWIVGDLRPGTWHAFRISAGNAVGESFGCAPTTFTRTFGQCCCCVMLCMKLCD